jgi:tricorn protease
MIAFSYMGDIWTVSSNGGKAERLTVHDAFDDSPVWSPDGSMIAFSSDREGNEDVYCMPSTGGVPRKLTCHSSWDNVQSWTRDGEGVLFTSSRDKLEYELYEVSLDGGLPKTIIDDRAFNAAISPDGRWIAYTWGRTPWWRKHYRGSASRDIWIRAYDGGRSYRLVGFEGDDDRPMWGADGRTIYFMSERDDHVMNIYKITVDLPAPGETGTPSVVGEPMKVTNHTEDGVQFARINYGGEVIVYEWNAGIWMFRVPGGQPEEVKITAASDLKWNAQERLSLSSQATEFAFSPDEKQLALVVHGEVFVCPFKDGETGTAIQITETNAREKDIAWMPDGETLLFASDETGNYDIYAVKSAEDDESRLSKALLRETTRLTGSEEDEFAVHVSPDGEKISFKKSDQYLWMMESDGSNQRQMLPEPEVLHIAWAPDSKWIAVSRTTMAHKEDIIIIPAAGGEPVNITKHPNDDFQPQWSDDGKRLSFASRTDDGQYTLKYVWLQEEDYWKTDEEWEEEEEAEEAPAEEGEDEDEEDGGVEVKIDFDDINERATTVMNMRGGYDFFAATPNGHHFAFRSRALGSHDLWIVDWEGNRLNQVSEGGASAEKLKWNNDGTTCYYISNGRISSVSIDPESGSITGRGGAGFSVQMTVDIAEERKQMFNEAWRLLWNRFYDPDFHGVDWVAVREKYEPLALAAYTEQEFREVVREMIGELSASHLGIYRWGGGGVSTGRLGFYHDETHPGPGILVKEVIPDSPADREGISAGDYIMSIDGHTIEEGDNYYCYLADTDGREILLEVADNLGGRNWRYVEIRPVGRWPMGRLVYEAWVKSRREMVDELSDGRLGYLHINGMGLGNLIQFEEDLFAQGGGKDGLIIDIRGNGGGSVHDEILRYLDRRLYGYSTSRTREPSYSPLELYTNPLALVIDESCYSDAEIFPMGWKALGLGPVIGTPTYGAVIGTQDLELIDGTYFRVPSSGWFDLEGKNLENWGIEPDYRVDYMPEELSRGEDRQLGKAVEVLMKEL